MSLVVTFGEGDTSFLVLLLCIICLYKCLSTKKKKRKYYSTGAMSSTKKKTFTKESGDIIHINGNIGYSTNNNNNNSLEPYAFNCHHLVHILRTCVH